MKQYLLSVHHEGEFPEPEPAVMQQMVQAVEAFNADLQASGSWVFAGGLQPKQTATTIRYQDGTTRVTDGPWSPAKAQLGGFWVIQADDLDQALEIAERGAAACQGDVEVRPFQGE